MLFTAPCVCVCRFYPSVFDFREFESSNVATEHCNNILPPEWITSRDTAMKQVVLDWFLMCNRSEAGKVEFYATGLNLQAAEWFSKRLKRKIAVCLDTWLHWMSKTVVTGLTCMSVPSNKSKKVGWLLTQKWVAVIASVWWRHVMFSTELDCRLLLETQERRRRTSKHAAGVHPIINLTKAK